MNNRYFIPQFLKKYQRLSIVYSLYELTPNKYLLVIRCHTKLIIFYFLDRLFSLMYQRSDYKIDLAELAMLEFKTIQSPNFEDLDVYLKIVRLSKMSLLRKLKHMANILLYFRSLKKNSQPEASLEPKAEVVIS